MNPLQIDEATGFLTSPGNAQYGFTAAKKLKFIELSQQYRKDGKFPHIATICEAIGINFSTFERHLEQDGQFREMWSEVASHVEYECISDMHDLRKKQPLFMFGLLRYLNPKRWSPDNKMNIQVDFKATDGILNKAQAIDADISPVIAPKMEQLPSETHILEQDMPSRKSDAG